MAVRGIETRQHGEVGWILINDYQATVEAGMNDDDYIGVHEGIGIALDEMRWDDSVRVVVMTGANDGEFYRFSRRSHWDDERFSQRLAPGKPAAVAAPERKTPTRTPSAHEVLAMIEKPVIARVNGDAIGFGQSLLWGCDFIVAREDALIAWGHTGLGEIVDSNGERRGFPWAMTPSYGTVSILHLTPVKLKEFMMLSKVYTARQMADMDAFNYAVPAEELDGVVDHLIAELLARPDSVLAHTKSLCNKHLLNQYNLTEDLAGAYTRLDLHSQYPG